MICKLKTPIALDGRTKKTAVLGTSSEHDQYVINGKAQCFMS